MIVQMFSNDMQHVLKQKITGHYDHPTGPAGGKRPKKIPRHLQAKIGEATNLYTFGKFDEAIPLFEQVITEMPELAEVTHTMSLIYEEKGDLTKAFTYAFLSAYDARKDTGKWKQCALLCCRLGNLNQAIYCYNRAWKSLDA